MLLRATNHRRIFKLCQSGSSAEMRLDFRKLLNEYKRRFASKVLQELFVTVSNPALQSAMREWDGRQKLCDFLTLDELTFDAPIAVKPNGSNVATLANDFEDFATGDALCLTSQFADLDSEVAERFEVVKSEILTFTEELMCQYGPLAAETFLKSFQRLVEDEYDRLRRDMDAEHREHWSPSAVANYKKHATLIRKWIPHPAWWLRLAAYVLPLFFSQRIFPKANQARVERLLHLPREVQLHRLHKAARERLLAALQRLTGADGQPGFISELLDHVRQAAVVFPRLNERFQGVVLDPVRSDVIEPIRHLDDVIQRRTGKTLGDVYFKLSDDMGFSPNILAGRIRKQGLDCDGRILMLPQWHEADPNRLVAAFDLNIEEFLGMDDPRREIDFINPTRPVEHLAGIGLGHSELYEVTTLAIAELAKRLHSFAERRPHAADKSKREVFIYCHHDQRATWEQRLHTHFTPSVAAQHRRLAQLYDLSNPHVLVVTIFESMIAGGLLDGFHRWQLLGNLARLESKVIPLRNRQLMTELRLLSQRETDTQYCQDLFASALKGGVIKADRSTGGFLPTKSDRRIDVLFEERTFEAEWQSSDHFHQLLKGNERGNSLLALIVEEQVPGLSGFRHRAAMLASLPDADTVAAELVQLGVLEENASRQFRVTFAYTTKLYGLCDLLFAATSQTSVPRSRDDFVALIQRDDDLHDVIFFALADAVVLTQLADHEVPAPVREYIATTLKL